MRQEIFNIVQLREYENGSCVVLESRKTAREIVQRCTKYVEFAKQPFGHCLQLQRMVQLDSCICFNICNYVAGNLEVNHSDYTCLQPA